MPGNRPAAKTLIGLPLLLLGLACLAFMLLNLAQDLSLWVLGQHTTAQVVDLWIEESGEDQTGQPTFQYFLRYRFTTADGQVITKVSSVSATEWVGLGQGRGELRYSGGEGAPGQAAAGTYHEQIHVPEYTIGGLEKGGAVDVVYFPPYPAHNRLDDSRYVPVLACTYVPATALSLAALLSGWHLVQPDLVGLKEGLVRGGHGGSSNKMGNCRPA